MTGDLRVIASDSEAIQTEPQRRTESLDRFALLAMTSGQAAASPTLRRVRLRRNDGKWHCNPL